MAAALKYGYRHDSVNRNFTRESRHLYYTFVIQCDNDQYLLMNYYTLDTDIKATCDSKTEKTHTHTHTKYARYSNVFYND